MSTHTGNGNSSLEPFFCVGERKISVYISDEDLRELTDTDPALRDSYPELRVKRDRLFNLTANVRKPRRYAGFTRC
jgi:hypothetical protein